MHKYKMLFCIVFIVAVIAADAEAGEKIEFNLTPNLRDDLRNTAMCDILNDAAFKKLYATGVGMTPEMTKITDASDYYEKRGTEIMQAALAPDTPEVTAWRLYRRAAKASWKKKMDTGEWDFEIELLRDYGGCDRLLNGARKHNPLPKTP